MHVTDVRRIPDPHGDAARHVVLLAEDGGPATLRLWIGAHEAAQLAVALGEVELPRPSSYRTFAALLTAASARLADVTITDLVDGVFIAQLDTGNGATVDARPSDALNLALALDVPIHVSRQVLDRNDDRGPAADLGPDTDDHQVIAAAAVAAMAASRPRLWPPT